MGKFLKIGGLLFCSIFFMSGTVAAYPYIEVAAFVHPDSATTVDLGGGITKFLELEYTFIVTAADNGAEMDGLTLGFENDVFKSITNPDKYNPADWTSSTATSTTTGTIFKISSAGTTLGLGEKLTFMVDAWVFTDALTDSSLWDEGQIWSQSVLASDTLNGGHGTSTTAPAPEPTTMLLLGTGLAGMVGVVRRRKVRKT